MDSSMAMFLAPTPDVRLFVWRSNAGFAEVDDALAASGVDSEGWVLGAAQAISGDGRVVAGAALCGGKTAVYRVVLP